MDESRGNAFYQIAYDDRLVGLDRDDARQEYGKVKNWEYSLEERVVAARSIIRIARKVRLDSLALAAEESPLLHTFDS